MIKIKNILAQKILINLTYALIAVIYFTFISTQYTKLDANILEQYIRASSMLFLGISILMMEIAYRKNEGLTFFNGIEFLAMAVFVLLTQHMPKILGCTMQEYALSGANFIAIYYILKSAILYTKEQQDKLNSLSDIKEIVKDEPVKKVSKRKNKKVEEGK